MMDTPIPNSCRVVDGLFLAREYPGAYSTAEARRGANVSGPPSSPQGAG